MIEEVAAGWETQQPERSLACFNADAVYLEPPDIQLFVGHEALRPYFAAVPAGTTMTIHRTWFDPATQSGAFEFTFAGGSATHGVAAITLKDGRISEWCEFQQAGPLSWAEFKRLHGKSWSWNSSNYPPKREDASDQDSDAGGP